MSEEPLLEEEQSPDGFQKARRIALMILLGILATFFLGEIAIRILNPTPRIQVIRSSHNLEFEVVDGVPVWRGDGTTGRENLSCLDSSPTHRVVVIGSSILFGSSLETEEVFSSSLPERLNQAHPDRKTCFFNFAQPGFTFGSKWIRTQQAFEKLKPDLLIFEIWYNDINPFALLRDQAVNIGHLRVNEWNHPDLFGLPLSVNKWLLEHSYLYHYASLALATDQDQTRNWRDFVLHELSKVVRLGKETGTPVLFVFAPNLNTSLASQADRTSKEYKVVESYLQDIKAEYMFLSRELRDDDIMDIRLDECCHYNAAGMDRLTDVIMPYTEKLLGFPQP